ncbi:ribosomal RNA adenine dimethylase domain protein [hydrothermal vent metagenome]|uniref:Ribosomal RNA adenine dimethylase domain protein n=1 Tax=hydrothermal vent metagenome TaxID=652676 RepID=A0A1W1BKU1_9ZZZZ
MQTAIIVRQNRNHIARTLRYLYSKTLKIYRIFSGHYPQTKEYMRGNLENSFVFLQEFKKDMFNTGAVLPSSRGLSKFITDIADLRQRKTVVELGSGTGVFTREISKKLSTEATFFALEFNKNFANQTKQNCPNVTVYNDDAKNIQKYLYSHNKKSCDCIISGLPWSYFNEIKQNELIDNIYDVLENGGTFLAFSYIQSSFLPRGIKFRKLLEKKFRIIIKTKTVWTNLPPAFVYICIK